MHVYTEANRVDKFVEICERFVSNEKSIGDEEAILQKLGNLMNESHESCKNLYDCSCKELDSLQDQARYDYVSKF